MCVLLREFLCVRECKCFGGRFCEERETERERKYERERERERERGREGESCLKFLKKEINVLPLLVQVAKKFTVYSVFSPPTAHCGGTSVYVIVGTRTGFFCTHH